MAPLLATTHRPHIRYGLGDDAAVWQPSRSHRSVMSTDVSVEGVHFRRDFSSAQDIGFRVLAVSLSDLAAMGAKPVLATIAVTLPGDVTNDWLLTAYEGMVELARRTGTPLVGGDLSRGAALSFAVTVVGEVSPQRLALRSGARPRDVLAVTGALGRSQAGLALLQNPKLGHGLAVDLANDALLAYRRPEPRLAYAKFLAASKHLHAMLDLSDGLSLDLQRLTQASACGATLTKIPIAASTQAIATAAKADALAWARDAGEDYELLCSIDRRAFPYLAHRFEQHFSAVLHPIGYCTPSKELVQLIDDTPQPLIAAGWDHFR